MRFALLTPFCAAALCAVAVTATAMSQTAPATLESSTTTALAARSFTPSQQATRTLVAEAIAAPLFSSSAVTDPAPGTDSDLPDAPTAPVVDGGMGQSGMPHAPVTNQPVAPKYSFIILPGQGAVPLSAGGKVAFAFRQEISPFTMLSRVTSATWSQAIDSQPHYGQGWAPYGQRVGAAFARGAVQDLATMAVFDPIFRDDPRYYVLGRQHKFVNRVVYAATRVLVTRTDSGHQTFNAPLLLGYAAAAGANFAYYPQKDRNFGDAATGYAGSLGGAVLGMEVNEFLLDALRIAHLRHD